MTYQTPYKYLLEQDDINTAVGFARIEQDTLARRKLVAILKNPAVMYLFTEKACVKRLTTCFRRLTMYEVMEINYMYSRIKVVDEIEAEVK